MVSDYGIVLTRSPCVYPRDQPLVSDRVNVRETVFANCFLLGASAAVR